MARLHEARSRQEGNRRECRECDNAAQIAQVIEARDNTAFSPHKPLTPLTPCDMRLTAQALLLETQTIRPSIIASTPVASRVRSRWPSEPYISDSLPTPPLPPRAGVGLVQGGCRVGADTHRLRSVASPPVASQLRWLQRMEAEAVPPSPIQPSPLPLGSSAHPHKAPNRLLHAMVRGLQAPARAQRKQRLPEPPMAMLLPARATIGWDGAIAEEPCRGLYKLETASRRPRFANHGV